MVIRCPAAAALAVSALLLAACSAGSSAGQPLISGTQQKGVLDCAPAPNPAPSAGTPAWNSPTGFAYDWYFNASALPVEIESVSLIGNHNLVLHGAVVYRGPHDIITSDGWPVMGRNANPSAWAQRQNVPGAVIPPQPSTNGAPDPDEPEYAVIIDVSAKTPAGGYAIGQQVTYKQGNSHYTIRTYTGYAIVPLGRNGPDCDAADKAINAAWKNTPG